jgi:hypothetical protein
MKKYFKIALVLVIVASLFIVTGCEKKEKEKKVETVKISYELGKGTFSLAVPKDEEGNPKYEFTKEKPSELSNPAAFYLVTDTAVFGFTTSGLSYNTSVKYKEKYGDTKASFEGYLEYIEDKDLFDKSYLPGLEQFKINGRKALRYYNRVGGSGSYKYWGYFYMIGVDDIYPGSRAGMTVNYKTDDKPTETKEFDKETLEIIKSLKIEENK